MYIGIQGVRGQKGVEVRVCLTPQYGCFAGIAVYLGIQAMGNGLNNTLLPYRVGAAIEGVENDRQ